MTSAKPSTPPSSSNYPYDAIPSSPQPPQPPQIFILLPFSSTSGHRTCRRYISSAITVLLLAAAIYFLWPSDPYIKVVNLRLDRLKVHAAPVSLDIELGVRIKVRNPDVYSLDYKSLNVSVEYRGEQLGFVTSDDGSVKAFGTSYVDATLVLNGVEVISESIHLIEDLIKGSIPFTTTSEIRGSLGILLFNLPIAAKLSCEVVVNAHNSTIERQDCYPA
ncbi:putative Late embryogenesis abundant protein [Helianthus annuus]|nr:putative Late embryogenesis abundant protein [Helianthus annuus]